MRKIELIDVMRYYVNYIDIEKQILNDVHSHDEIVKMNALKKYKNAYMKIGRNFISEKDEDILEITKKYFLEGGSDIDELSSIFDAEDLLSGNSHNAKAAASKLLWLFNRGIIIMDNINREVLKVKTDNYADYTMAWEEAYKTKLLEIESVINEHKLKDVDSIIGEEWFKMRVFDQYLWSLRNN